MNISWSFSDQLARVLLLRDYNTRVVLLGTTMLGVCAGLMGVFLLLRRRSLAADVVSHASLPGIGLAYLVMEAIAPGSGKSTPGLLGGAFLTGLIGLGCTVIMQRFTRIKEDAAMAIVLSVFFGIGVALLTVIQSLPSGNAAGLSHFIYGKAASMVANDVRAIAWSALVVVVLVACLFKELSLLSFDEQFAAAQGWPVFKLDVLLLMLVSVVTVVGLQSVGMLLVVALMIVPATAARFWTHDLKRMAVISSVTGGLSATIGVFVSALFPRLAAGAVIVLAGTFLFVVSLLFGARNGIVLRGIRQRQRDRVIAREHLLRGLFEAIELRAVRADELAEELTQCIVSVTELARTRSWTLPSLRRMVRLASRAGLVVEYADGGLKLTELGAAEASRVVRSHRLWEIYLIEYADRSPARVDRDADDIEHDLGPEIIRSLERLLAERYAGRAVPPSPHALAVPSGGRA